MIEDDKISWKPKVKNYPHFDAPVSQREAKKLATSPVEVQKHKFFPFLSYKIITRRFSVKKPKERVINYCARKDAYIYSYYRHILLNRYNLLLESYGLNDCVIAYRKIVKGNAELGKGNIDFAKDAFDEVISRKECIAITLDITSFFESLNHSFIKQKWCKVLGVDKLPQDHYRVYRQVTNYKVVDFDECYIRLGMMTIEVEDGKPKKKYKFSRKEQPKQLCSVEEFREKIARGKTEYQSIIKNNPHVEKGELRGIPQGSPISDVIANMYLLDFDQSLKLLADKKGWYYRRYSDDILLLVSPDTDLEEVVNGIRTLLDKEGGYLSLKDNKSTFTKFYQADDITKCKALDEKGNIKNANQGLEYLGFSFDGRKINLKSQAIAKYYKKIRYGIKSHIKLTMDKAKANEATDLKSCINKAQATIYHKYSTPNQKWKKYNRPPANFITYVARAEKIMEDKSIAKQLNKHKSNIRRILTKEIKKWN
jgi:hypothetical protein